MIGDNTTPAKPFKDMTKEEYHKAAAKALDGLRELFAHPSTLILLVSDGPGQVTVATNLTSGECVFTVLQNALFTLFQQGSKGLYDPNKIEPTFKWWDAMNIRLADLIYRKNQGSLSTNEQTELDALQAAADAVSLQAQAAASAVLREAFPAPQLDPADKQVVEESLTKKVGE